MKKNGTDWGAIVIGAILIVVVALCVGVAFGLIPNPFQQDGEPWQPWWTDTGTSGTSGGTDQQTSPTPTLPPQTSSLAPTSLSVQVSPNPATMGGAVYGTVTSNGYNFPLTIYAKHTGAEEWLGTPTQQIEALLGPDGKFEHLQQINFPGYWEFWAKAGSVTSNTAYLTVQGIMVQGDKEAVSSPTYWVNFYVFSNFKNSPVQIFAIDHATGVSIPLQTGNTDDTGSIALGYNFNSFAPGNYEIDAVIAGQKASDYGGTCWLQVS